MRTRRSLFVFGALLAVGVLLAPQAALAQQTDLAATDVPTAVTLADGYAGTGDQGHVGCSRGRYAVYRDSPTTR